MSLDEAEDRFAAIPSAQSASDLITVSMTYWNDDMIGDETFAHKMTLVRDWLDAGGKAL
jgi:hypothetical protein